MMSGQKVRVRLLDEKADCIKARPKKMKIMGRQVLLYLECDVDHKRKVLRPQEIRNLMIVKVTLRGVSRRENILFLVDKWA